MWKACCVVVPAFRMAKVTEFLLLALLRKPSSTVSAPFRSSQSTMMALELFGAQDFLAGTDPAADFNIDEKLFQGGLEHTNDLGIRLRSSDSSGIEL